MSTHVVRSERGQVVPLLAVLLVFVALLGVGLVRVAGAASRRASAQAAADASALAGAAVGRPGAEAAAIANRAELVSYEVDVLDVIVVVRRSDVVARARARWEPTGPGWDDTGAGP